MADRIEFTSPRGEVLEACLNETWIFHGIDTRYYVLKLVFAGDALETVKAQIEDFLVTIYGSRKAKHAKRPFQAAEDRSKTFIAFKAKAEINGKPRTIALFDAAGKKVRQTLNIGVGSIVRVSGVMSSWDKDPGVSLYMDALQVIKCVEGRRTSFDPDDTPGGFIV